MLIVDPDVVKFAGAEIERVSVVEIDREASRLVVEWGDRGPHAVFADVPEQRVTVRVVHDASARAGGFVDGPRPGDVGELSVVFGSGAGHTGRRRLTATGVVTRVRYEGERPAGSARGGRERGVREVEWVLVSGDGIADPVALTEAGAGR